MRASALAPPEAVAIPPPPLPSVTDFGSGVVSFSNPSAAEAAGAAHARATTAQKAVASARFGRHAREPGRRGCTTRP